MAVRNRNAAFTLFITTYEEIRAAVGYLRRQEGDAAGITPTLYTGREPSKKKPVEDIPVKPETPPVVTPVVSPTPVPNTPVAHAAVGANGPFME